MKVLKIYFLDQPTYDTQQIIELNKNNNIDLILQIKADNQLQGIQYPLFEFEEIEGKTEEFLRTKISKEDIILACESFRNR